MSSTILSPVEGASVNDLAAEAAARAAGDALRVLKAGDTMTGQLTLPGGGLGNQAVTYAEAFALATGTAGLLQNYNISTTVGGTPASGTIRYNNATQASATEIRMSVTTSDGLDLTNFITQMAAGDTMYIQQETSSANYQRWRADSAPVIASGYATIAVTLLSSGGTGTTNFADALPIIVYGRSAAVPMTTDALAEGSLNLYFTGARVLNTVLTGWSVGTNTAVLATDTVTAAIGKLQAQITTNASDISTETSRALASEANLAAAINASGNVHLYLDPTDASDIGGYKQLLTTPSANAESTIVQACTGTSDILIGSFATASGVPGVTTIPAGTSTRTLYYSVSGGAARFKIEFYKRNTGGTETLLRSNYTDTLISTTVSPAVSALTDPSSYAVDSTDRLIMKLYAARVSGPTTVTVTLYAEGLVHASQVQTTFLSGGDTVKTPITVSGSRALADSDHDCLLRVTGAYTLTANSGLRADFRCRVQQTSASQVTFANGTATFRNSYGIGANAKTAAQYATVYLEPGPSSTELAIIGDITA